MASDAALLTAKFEDGRLELAAGGSWTAPHAAELETLVDRAAEDAAKAKAVSIDMRGVREFDTYGAWLLERLTRQWRSIGGQASVVGMPEHDRTLLKEMSGVNLEPVAPPARPNPIVSALAAVGRGMTGFGRDLGTFANMLGAIGVAATRVVARPRDFRFTSAVNQLDRVCWQAVPIILLITFLIGAIIAQQGIFHFRKFGAEMYAVDLVGILILREVGVLIVAIMVAGRSGSSYTAELGSMMMREEVGDGLIGASSRSKASSTSASSARKCTRRPRRHSHPARGRRAHRRHHGGRPLGQLLYRRARLDDDAGGGGCAPHHGLRSRRGAHPAARARADHRAPHI